MDVKEYKMVEDIDLDLFVKRINSYLQDNWQPHGSAFVRGMHFCQPMIRYKVYNTNGERVN